MILMFDSLIFHEEPNRMEDKDSRKLTTLLLHG